MNLPLNCLLWLFNRFTMRAINVTVASNDKLSTAISDEHGTAITILWSCNIYVYYWLLLLCFDSLAHLTGMYSIDSIHTSPWHNCSSHTSLFHRKPNYVNLFVEYGFKSDYLEETHWHTEKTWRLHANAGAYMQCWCPGHLYPWCYMCSYI